MELARLLYQDGFSLVLVARDVGSLQDIKESLETEATRVAVTEGQQGRLGPSSREWEEEDGQNNQNRDANQGSSDNEDHEDDNAMARRQAYPQSQSHSHTQQPPTISSGSSSPISDSILDVFTSTKTMVSSNVVDTGASAESATAIKQQQPLSAHKISPSSSLRRRQSRRRSSGGSSSSNSEFDRRATHAPQQPSSSTPTPSSPGPDALDATPSSMLQRLPSPPRQEIVLIPADLSSRCVSPSLLLATPPYLDCNLTLSLTVTLL